MLTNISELKKLEARFYQHRLRNRDILPQYELLRKYKESLFNIRYKTASLRKSLDWNREQILKVIKSLKSNKARDSSGLIFELFKQECAGQDLIKSLIIMLNQIKRECIIPEFVKLTSITSIF